MAIDGRPADYRKLSQRGRAGPQRWRRGWRVWEPGGSGGGARRRSPGRPRPHRRSTGAAPSAAFGGGAWGRPWGGSGVARRGARGCGRCGGGHLGEARDGREECALSPARLTIAHPSKSIAWAHRVSPLCRRIHAENRFRVIHSSTRSGATVWSVVNTWSALVEGA